MRGSIRTKVTGKVYELRVSLGRDPVTGRYRQKSITVRGTRSDAQRALRRLLDDVETGQHRQLDGGSRTFGELLDDWLAFKIAADRSPTTVARYRGLIEQQLKPALGALTLDRLSTRAFDDLYRALGTEIGAATILKVHLVARGALDRAIRWGWIERNPAAAAEPPPVHPPVIRPPIPEELARLLDTAEREDPVFALWLRVAAATGARRGELCALRWNDLDFDARTVTIERGVVVVAGGVLERPTKTHNRRTLALDGTTLELLAGHRERERRTAASCGVVASGQHSTMCLGRRRRP